MSDDETLSRRSLLKRTAQAGAAVGLAGAATGSASADVNCRYVADVDLGCRYEETSRGCEVHGTLTVWKYTWTDGAYRAVKEKVMDYGCSHYDPLYPGSCDEVTDDWISEMEDRLEDRNEDALNPC